MKSQMNVQRSPYKKGDSKKMLRFQSRFEVKEAYNSIRTNIMFTDMNRKCPVYVVTSPLPNEGKTINCINLAISFAQMGKRTLLIDADLRNPAAHYYFGAQLGNGLSEILANLETDAKYEPTGYPYLMYLNAGLTPPNPAELLAGDRLDKLLEAARMNFDYIFIDSPPVCVVTDASVLAKKVTGYILVVRNGISDIYTVKQAVNDLESVGGSVTGFLLNSVNPKTQILYRTIERRYRDSDRRYEYRYAAD